jgi:tripartite-type tricarboxylate transporter receptor subunit TctC
MKNAGLATLLCVTLLALAGPARTEDVADFFRGKTVRMIVGVGVGSGYDLNARLLARYLPNHIPGCPAVIVQNQPGAGSLTMTNQLFIAGPFDGTAIGASFNGMPTTPLFQPAAAALRSEQADLAGQHQSRDPAHIRVAERAGTEPGGAQDH